jgi:hypothetical protein
LPLSNLPTSSPSCIRVHPTCKMQWSHYPHHLIRAGMYQFFFWSVLYFAHALQTLNGWTGNTFGVSRAHIPSEQDPQRGEFPSSLKILPPVRKSYSRPSSRKYTFSHTWFIWIRLAPLKRPPTAQAGQTDLLLLLLLLLFFSSRPLQKY